MDRRFTFGAVKYKTFGKATNAKALYTIIISMFEIYIFALITMEFDYVNPSYLFNLGV